MYKYVLRTCYNYYHPWERNNYSSQVLKSFFVMNFSDEKFGGTDDIWMIFLEKSIM